MEIGHKSNSVAPSMRAKQQPMLSAKMRHFQPKTEPPTDDDVGLQNISAALYDEFPKVGRASVQLAGGNTQRCRTAKLGEAGEIGMIQRFFQPVDAILLQFSSDVQGPLHIPGSAQITGHPPPLVRVNYDVHRVSDCLTNT